MPFGLFISPRHGARYTRWREQRPPVMMVLFYDTFSQEATDGCFGCFRAVAFASIV